MSQQQNTNAAELYEHYFVPGIHARWTPLFLKHANPTPASVWWISPAVRGL